MFGLYDDPGKGTVTTNTTDEKKNDPASHTVDLENFREVMMNLVIILRKRYMKY